MFFRFPPITSSLEDGQCTRAWRAWKTCVSTRRSAHTEPHLFSSKCRTALSALGIWLGWHSIHSEGPPEVNSAAEPGVLPFFDCDGSKFNKHVQSHGIVFKRETNVCLQDCSDKSNISVMWAIAYAVLHRHSYRQRGNLTLRGALAWMAAFFHSQLLAALWWTSLPLSPWGETFLTVKLVRLRKHGLFCYYNNSCSKITGPLQGFKTHINLFSQGILYMQLNCCNHNSLWILTSVWSSVRYFKSKDASVWTY